MHPKHSGFPNKTRMRLIALCLFTALILAPALAIAQAEPPEEPRTTPLFESTKAEPMAVRLTLPWRDIERDEENQDPYPASIEFTDEQGNTKSLDMTVERRGITRQVVCRYPPIKLRFEKDTVDGTLFDGQKSLKMVTHCDKGSRFEQYYILEMLAYQMYNLITDMSFRVRPLAVTYIDSERGGEDGPRFGFLIEDDSDVANRFGLDKIDLPEISPSQMDPQEASNLSLFQFMIGNLDYAALSGPDPAECCHNTKLIGAGPNQEPIYVVPYDFDSSGIVNAHYAAPPANLKVRRIGDRLFRGFCAHNNTLDDAKQRFLAEEQAIYALVDNHPELNNGTRKKARRYLEEFFEIMKDPKDFQKDIIDDCRT